MGKVNLYIGLIVCLFLTACANKPEDSITDKGAKPIGDRYCIIASKAYSISGNKIYNHEGLFYQAKNEILQASWDSSSNSLAVLCPLNLDIVSSLEKKLIRSIPAQGVYQKMRVRKGKLLLYTINGSSDLQLIDLKNNVSSTGALTHSNPFKDFDINDRLIAVVQSDELLLFNHNFQLLDKKTIKNGHALAMDNIYLAAKHSGKIWQYSLSHSNLKDEIVYEN